MKALLTTVAIAALLLLVPASAAPQTGAVRNHLSETNAHIVCNPGFLEETLRRFHDEVFAVRAIEQKKVPVAVRLGEQLPGFPSIVPSTRMVTSVASQSCVSCGEVW